MPRGLVLKNEVCERTQKVASFTPFQTNFKISLMKYSLSLNHKHKHMQFVRGYAKMDCRSCGVWSQIWEKINFSSWDHHEKSVGTHSQAPKTFENAVPMRLGPTLLHRFAVLYNCITPTRNAAEMEVKRKPPNSWTNMRIDLWW